eukprot:12660089-Prorocentrum_lima.AAC.1
MTLRISSGASDFNLSGATHGMSILSSPRFKRCAIIRMYRCHRRPVTRGPVKSTCNVPNFSNIVGC